MHARVTFAQVKPEDVEDSARLFEEGIIPAAREEEGFYRVALPLGAISVADSVAGAASLADASAGSPASSPAGE